MINTLQIQVLPEVAATQNLLKSTIAQELNISEKDIKHIEILKRSIDARQRTTKINLRVDVYTNEPFVKKEEAIPEYKDVTAKDEVIIIGAGPAGLAAATIAAERGHQVDLFEGANQVGGQFNMATIIPGKEEYQQTIRYYGVMLEKFGVTVRLKTKATVEMLTGKGYDEVISGKWPKETNFQSA